MAASSGPSQRKISISTLVYSTLGPALGMLPSEEKVNDPNLSSGEEEKNSSGEEAAAGVGPINQDKTAAPPQRVCEPTRSPGGEILQSLKANKPSDLSRLYSSPASSFGEKARLDFKSKSGAGSMSSAEQATLPKQVSISGEEGSEAPLSPVSKHLQSQMNSASGDPLSPR